MTAPSSTRSDRSTSMVKSTWPGVSMMLMRWLFQMQVVAAEVIVMPRSCSCAMWSMVGGAVVDLTDLVALPRVVQDALGRGRLAGIDVRHDADVAGALEGVLTLGHRQITSVFRGLELSRNVDCPDPRKGPDTIDQCTGAIGHHHLREHPKRTVRDVRFGQRPEM